MMKAPHASHVGGKEGVFREEAVRHQNWGGYVGQRAGSAAGRVIRLLLWPTLDSSKPPSSVAAVAMAAPSS